LKKKPCSSTIRRPWQQKLPYVNLLDVLVTPQAWRVYRVRLVGDRLWRTISSPAHLDRPSRLGAWRGVSGCGDWLGRTGTDLDAGG
jgi:hypothetical protein